MACASRQKVQRDYSVQTANAPTSPSPGASKRTVVLFLIDGLPERTLRSQLEAHHLPNLQQHFLGSDRKIMQAHSILPSSSFPNISSLLHEQPVNETGAIGNSIVKDGRVLHFESMLDRSQYGDMMRGKNIFTRLREKGNITLSLDYGLGVDATVSADPLDLKEGLAFEIRDFIYLDQKRIDSLNLVLKDNPIEKWPDFIFIHLVGLDLISHQFGSQSNEALEYLRSLDEKLKDVFARLRNAENEKATVISMLTADHGFSRTISDYVNIEEVTEKLDLQLSVINEVRLAALYYNHSPKQNQLQKWATSLLQNPGLEIIGYRYEDTVRLISKKLDLSFIYKKNLSCPHGGFGVSVKGHPAVCPEQLEPKAFHPFFLSNIAAYFQAEKHPDMIVIPTANVAFHRNEVGYHGGPTAEETLVPLLMRNSKLQNPTNVPALWELLQFL